MELDGLKPFVLDEVLTPMSTPDNSGGQIHLNDEFVEYINEPSTAEMYEDWGEPEY